ncbi:hypothetical protein ABL78_6073 [Leptomonas seymouri]|uniref:Ribosomal RNA methyltransferase FtsJ domain-containing protein n=1 Tax=Leptomonas seymouri TaxID=5684 RepID=A0A0N1IIL5_LEPSE|nr:hypothetical protein ABL78_6073 [Leptomonas seymouri]|eukprot:KPI84868.1 hypothetical protein ABL78_6073 [Leptomonas seymouri]
MAEPSTDTQCAAPNVDTSKGAETPLYSRAKRWRLYLHENSVAFRTLQAERERGWQSSALDAWYARRQTPVRPSSVSHHTSENKNVSTTPGASTYPAAVAAAASASGSLVPTGSDASASGTTPAAGTTSFAEADVAVLAERYRQHARRITQLAASSFFTKSAPSAEPPLFLDLGCAPGGVTKYLLEDLKWRGVGVTLASANGGIEVDPALIEEGTHKNNYLLLDGDVTQPPTSWCRSAAYARLASHNPPKQDDRLQRPKQDVPTWQDDVFLAGLRSPPTFHFVNCGAVLDHGQRQRWPNEAGESAPSNTSAGDPARQSGGAASLPVSAMAASAAGAPPCGSSASVLPWFSLLVPQLKTALTYTAEGGAMMLVHGAPQCASLFILLQCMEEVVGAAHTSASNVSSSRHGCEARLLETMHLAKPPVYVLWTDVWSKAVDSAGASPSRVTKESSKEAQRRLLESLDATSPRISPFEPDNASCESSAEASRCALHTPTTLEEKQRFWLGESDEGFRLAVEGFARYGAIMEAIWSRVEAFLRRRRERAEREMTSSTTQHTNREASRGRVRHAVGAGKRMRSDA